jgi:hypothetical protein
MMDRHTLWAGVMAAGIGGGSIAHAEPWSLQEALGDPDRLTVSGSFRARYESLDGQFRPGKDGGDQLISLRSTLFGEFDLGGVKLGAELFDSRAYEGDLGGAVSTGEVNTFEFVQAYAKVRLGQAGPKAAGTELTLGRFTMDLGSRRLVGRNNFRNTTNAFTGAKLDWNGTSGAGLTAFYSLPQNRLPDDQASILDNETHFDRERWGQRFWGLFYARPDLPWGGSGEAFVFGLKEKDAASFRSRNRDIVTIGGRLYRDPSAGAYDYEFEGGWQTGETRGSTSPADTRDLDVDAWYLHAEVARTFEAAWSPRVSLEYDYASGDKDPTDGKSQRFDSLYGTRRPDFGPTGIYGPIGRSNLSSPGVRIEVKPDKRWDGFLFYRALWLVTARDSFANTGVRDASGRSGKFAGHQIEARARYWIVPKQVRLDFGGAYLATGKFLERAPNATRQGDTLYGYADVTVTF